MTEVTVIIIKVGGSLQKTNKLADLCRALGDIGKEHSVILIPGGGTFADSVRNCTRGLDIDQDTAHWMAILAMNQYGYLLASLIPGGICTEDIGEAKLRAGRHRPVVFLPYRLLKDRDPLPHSWDVTSDSIAAWIAGYLDSKKLLLIKSIELQPALLPDRNYKNPVDLSLLDKTDIIDPMFCRIMKELNTALWIINGNRPEQLTGLLEKDGMA